MHKEESQNVSWNYRKLNDLLKLHIMQYEKHCEFGEKDMAARQLEKAEAISRIIRNIA